MRPHKGQQLVARGAVLLALGGCAVQTSPRATTPPPATSTASRASSSAARVVYQGDGITVIGQDGAGAVQLAKGLPGAEHPDWSPDGARVAFESDFHSIQTTAADGTDVRELYPCAAPCGAVQEPAWSPDGSEIAFGLAETSDGIHTSRAAVVAVDVVKGGLRTLAEDRSGAVWFYTPRWSGDGTSLVVDKETFASTKFDESVVEAYELLVIPARGGPGHSVVRWRQQSSGPSTGQSMWPPAPDWNKRSDLIVYSRDGNLHSVAPDGSGVAAMTTLDGTSEFAIQPTFTPDGTRIAFTHVRTTSGTTVNTGELLDLEGGTSTVLGGGVQMTHPRLSP